MGVAVAVEVGWDLEKSQGCFAGFVFTTARLFQWRESLTLPVQLPVSKRWERERTRWAVSNLRSQLSISMNRQSFLFQDESWAMWVLSIFPERRAERSLRVGAKSLGTNQVVPGSCFLMILSLFLHLPAKLGSSRLGCASWLLG